MRARGFRMRCRGGMACALAALLSAGIARALPPERVTESARAVLSHPAYQTELPLAEGGEGATAGSTSSKRRPASHGLGRGDDDGGVTSAPGPPALDSSILLWGMLAVA